MQLPCGLVLKVAYTAPNWIPTSYKDVHATIISFLTFLSSSSTSPSSSSSSSAFHITLYYDVGWYSLIRKQKDSSKFDFQQWTTTSCTPRKKQRQQWIHWENIVILFQHLVASSFPYLLSIFSLVSTQFCCLARLHQNNWLTTKQPTSAASSQTMKQKIFAW